MWEMGRLKQSGWLRGMGGWLIRMHGTGFDLEIKFLPVVSSLAWV
jgi:hypothetical protein